MGHGAKVSGFLSNLLGDDDEEDVVLASTGGQRVAKADPRKRAAKKAAPASKSVDVSDPADGEGSPAE
jgi:hypothetical protein